MTQVQAAASPVRFTSLRAPPGVRFVASAFTRGRPVIAIPGPIAS